jgi:hypothetical protein
MHDLDPATRRNLHYASLPAKVNVGFLAFLLCAVIGLFSFACAIYIFGMISRAFGGH